MHSLVFDLELSADLEQPLQQDLPHFGADLGGSEVSVVGEAGGDLGAEGLVIVDEVLNDVRKVGEDLRRTRRKILGLMLGLSSNGFGTVCEVRSKISGSGRSFLSGAPFFVKFSFRRVSRSLTDFSGELSVFCVILHIYSVIF